MRPSSAAVVCLVLCAIVATPARAQRKGPQGENYKSIERLPDWSGIWVWPFELFAAENAALRNPNWDQGPRLSPAAMVIRDARIRELSSGAAASDAPRAGTCRPGGDGMPGVMRFAFGVEFLFTPGRVTILLEQGGIVRRVYTDGRAHDTDAEATRAGDSIGHWEGDTLVVDTVAITPGNAILPGTPTTAGTHVVERIRRLDARRLQVDTVIEDPTMLRQPWRRTRVYERSDFGWLDRTCTNDRDGLDQEPDLTPPR